MADELNDPKDPTKVEESATTEKLPAVDDDTPVEEEGAIGLEEMDAVIKKIDPQFEKHIAKIGPNEEMQQGIVEGFGLDFTAAAGATAEVSQSMGEKIKAAPFSLLKFLKAKFISTQEKVARGLRAFKYFSATKKISVFAMIGLLGASGYVAYRSLTKGLFPAEEELFVSSLKDWSQDSLSFEPQETESLYESTHSSKNIMATPRMVVNLRRSTNSGENPMAAVEFYIEGTASDVMVEVKDREAEVKDLLQRNIEEMTFDQLSSGEGKQLLCEKLRKEVNKILTKGKIRRFFIKTAIVKS